VRRIVGRGPRQGSTEVVRANKNLELALEVSTKAQAVVLANVDVLVCEADLTEQWQLGPQMVLSQGLRLVPESHKLLEEMRAIQERVGPLFRYGQVPHTFGLLR
jgi:hypothetical protein